MKLYDMQSDDHQKQMDRILGGQVKMIDGQWYWTEWHVAYAQSPMDTSDNFVTYEQAMEKFNERLASVRQAWGHNGHKYTEKNEGTEECPRIRFRNVLKSGKPGKMTGLLYMYKMERK